MKVNGKEIKGIFQYSPDVLFSKGDFVVEQDKMFICIEPSIGNLPSSTPNKFKPYLGGDVADEISDGNTGLVSSYTLGQALSSVSASVNGVIENEITEDGKAFFRDYFGNESGIDLGDKYLNPLDNLIVSEINQTVMKVDKTVAAPIIGDVTNFPILRQYTYKGNNWTRLQEMIDVDNGLIYFRTSIKSVPSGQPEENYNWEAPSEWKCSTVSSKFREILESISSNYFQKCNDLEIEKQRLNGSFKYREVDFTKVSGIVVIPLEKVGKIITVCLRYSESDNIKRTDSLTMDISTIVDEKQNKITYKTAGGKTIEVSKQAGGIALNTDSECEIIDIYTRNIFTYRTTTPASSNMPIYYKIVNQTTIQPYLNSNSQHSYIKLVFSDTDNIIFPTSTSDLTVLYDNGATLRFFVPSTSNPILAMRGTITYTNNFDFNKLKIYYVDKLD